MQPPTLPPHTNPGRARRGFIIQSLGSSEHHSSTHVERYAVDLPDCARISVQRAWPQRAGVMQAQVQAVRRRGRVSCTDAARRQQIRAGFLSPIH